MRPESACGRLWRPRGAVAALLVVCLLDAASGQDQGASAAGEAFERGLQALADNRPDDGIAAFQQYLKEMPGEPIAAYNLACGYSLKKDTASALAWLWRAVDWGYEDVEHMLEDPDLAHARGDPAFWRIVEDIQRRMPLSVPRLEIPATADEDPALDLVAMLRSDLGSGAGIIIGRAGDRLLVATANHVVRQGRAEAQTLEVQLKPLSPRWHRAVVLPPIAEADLDVAFIAVEGVVKDLELCSLPLHLGGDSQRVRRGDEVFPVGYPNGILWAMPLAPDHVSQALPAQISFESQFIRVGFSGGALLDGDGEVVGMIAADEPPLGRAIPLAIVLDAARRAGHPVQLSTPQVRAGLPIHEAVRRGDVSGLRRLLDDCADANAADAEGRTALHDAAERGSIDAIRLLLDAGARPHAWALIGTDDDEREWGTPLHVAAQSGRIDAVQALIAGGADPDLKTLRRFADRPVHTWYTLLHIAAVNDHAAVAEGLLAAGADPEGASRGETTPLVVAAERNAAGVARALLEHGAAVDGGARGERAHPIHHAAEAGAVDVLRLLVDRGAGVRARGNGAREPLHLAAAHGRTRAAELLLAAGADANAPGYLGNTALHEAAANGHSAVVRTLLDARADPDRVNERGLTPISIAADRGDNESLLALTGAGAHVGLALHVVLERENVEGARILIAGGADLSFRNSEGEEPIHVAARRGTAGAIELLVSAGADVTRDAGREGKTALHLAAERGHADAVGRLIAAKAPLDPQDGSGRTPLYEAVQGGHVDVVARLLQAGADPDIASQATSTQNTPVAWAASNGPPTVLEILLEAGADPNRSGDGASMSPLSLAASDGSVEKVRLLLQAGATAVAPGTSRAPLHYAVRNEKTAADVIAVLLDAGHAVDVADANGVTPLHEAAESRHPAAVAVLLERGAPVNARALCDVTPLWSAVARSTGATEDRTLAVVEQLIAAGADADAQNTCTKETLLAAAEKNGLVRVRQLLVAAGVGKR